MVILGGIEGIETHHLGCDRPAKDLRWIELVDVGLGDPLLFRGSVKDCRAILRAFVRSLTIQLCRVMRDGEVHLKQLAVGNARWIVDDLDSFGVSGPTRADRLVLGRTGSASRVSRSGAHDSLDVLEHGLDTPKAASSENGGLLTWS